MAEWRGGIGFSKSASRTSTYPSPSIISSIIYLPWIYQRHSVLGERIEVAGSSWWCPRRFHESILHCYLPIAKSDPPWGPRCVSGNGHVWHLSGVSVVFFERLRSAQLCDYDFYFVAWGNQVFAELLIRYGLASFSPGMLDGLLSIVRSGWTTLNHHSDKSHWRQRGFHVTWNCGVTQ